VKASGRDVTDLRYWHVLGLWKIAIIAEGIRRRARSMTPAMRQTEGRLMRASPTSSSTGPGARPSTADSSVLLRGDGQPREGAQHEQ
jgi:hypothetical protein